MKRQACSFLMWATNNVMVVEKLMAADSPDQRRPGREHQDKRSREQPSGKDAPTEKMDRLDAFGDLG